MIKAELGKVSIEGEEAIVSTEAEFILRSLKKEFKKVYGKEEAKAMIMKIARNAVMGEKERTRKAEECKKRIEEKTIPELAKELNDFCEEIFSREESR